MSIVKDMAIVRRECCNLINDMCIGMTTRNTWFREMGKCYIAEKKKCHYYNKCVHPLFVMKQRVEDAKKKARESRWKR